MKRIHFLEDGPNGLAIVPDGYDSAAEARKDFSKLSPGKYHLISFVEAEIMIEPPAMPTENVVKRGTTLITRARAETTEPTPKTNGKGKAPAK